MKAIEEAILRLEFEKASFNARIDGRIEGLKEALKLHTGAPVQLEQKKRTRRGNLKETVLDLISLAADKGLSTEQCILEAKAKGILLVPSSVSSLLSRLKSDDILFYDGEKYRLKKFAGIKQAA